MRGSAVLVYIQHQHRRSCCWGSVQWNLLNNFMGETNYLIYLFMFTSSADVLHYPTPGCVRDNGVALFSHFASPHNFLLHRFPSNREINRLMNIYGFDFLWMRRFVCVPLAAEAIGLLKCRSREWVTAVKIEKKTYHNTSATLTRWTLTPLNSHVKDLL